MHSLPWGRARRELAETLPTCGQRAVRGESSRDQVLGKKSQVPGSKGHHRGCEPTRVVVLEAANTTIPLEHTPLVASGLT